MQWVPKAKNDQVQKRIVQLILFIFDSGCTKHMMGNLKLLCNFVEKFLGTIRFGNDHFAPILGYGDLVLGNVTINRVYYVKGLNHNLFLVGQFCDADLEVAFRKSTCFLRDLQGNDLLTGYSTQSKGYRVYNKRTRMIVESIHIRFDKIKEVFETSVANNTSGLVPQRQKASDYDNPDPVQQRQDVYSSANADVPLHQDLHQHHQLIQMYMLRKTTIIKLKEGEQLQDDEFTNPFCALAQEETESSSYNIGNSNVLTFNQPHVSEYQLTKDHLLDQVRRNPSRLVKTRRPLATDPEMCMFALTEEVYVAQPDRFVDSDHPEKVYRLRKALYGLKQAPRAWYDELSKFLTSKVFTKGLQIHQSPSGIFTNQSKYTLEILHKHGMDKGQSIGTPMAMKPKLDAYLSGNPVEQTDYRSKIRSLMYLTSSRPDIVQAHGMDKGQSIGTPMAMKPKLDAYLSGNPVEQTDYRSKIRSLMYLTSSRPDIVQADSSFELTTFSDADHAGCIDSRKSTSRGILFLGDMLVSWISKKQNCTAMSSAEAEYMALSASCAQVITEYQLADMFTNALPKDRFKYLVRRIGMRCLTPAELEYVTQISRRGKYFFTESLSYQREFDILGLELFLQDIQSFELKKNDSVRIILRHVRDECDKGRMPTKIEMTLEQSQQGVSNDILMDVKSAFLYGKIEEEVNVCQPLGFEDPKFFDKVYKVEKALYGLHQALRAWYETLSTYLLDNRFQRCQIDRTIFIKRVKGDILLVQVYVDDNIFRFTRKEMCTEFEKMMHKKFKMSSIGEHTFFLGLRLYKNDDWNEVKQLLRMELRLTLAELKEEERVARQKEEDANIAEWDDIQAMMKNILQDLEQSEEEKTTNQSSKEESNVNLFVPMDSEVVKDRTEGSETIAKESSKRAGKELISDKSKNQKLDEKVEAKVDNDQEEPKMKMYMKIVSDDEVAINAIPLATKPPIIVCWKIIKEGKISSYHIIRADGSSKRPEEAYERVLWGDLKVMFEPNIESGRVLPIRIIRLTPLPLEMYMCLKDHLDATDRMKHTSNLENYLDFAEEILEEHVLENEAITLSNEEIALDEAASEARPNGKLIHNSILNGPYVRRMILEPGDANHEVTVTETFHVQTDDELPEKELKQIKANDQAIQTILLGLPEDIYAAVDSCKTA
nr:ribonuclease H-like domain-containing protein [Tanacetum cinerariifolium]